jgi:hypothetical protein
MHQGHDEAECSGGLQVGAHGCPLRPLLLAPMPSADMYLCCASAPVSSTIFINNKQHVSVMHMQLPVLPGDRHFMGHAGLRPAAAGEDPM